jgi:hypothetical protein
MDVYPEGKIVLLQILHKFSAIKMHFSATGRQTSIRFLKKSRRTETKVFQFFPSFSNVLVLGRQTSAFFSSRAKRTHVM